MTQQAEHTGISASLIATRKDLEDFVRDKDLSSQNLPKIMPKILRGWRQEIFGTLAFDQKKEFEEGLKK